MLETVEFSGEIKDMKLIPVLVQEVQEICESMKWEYAHEDFGMQLAPHVNEKMGLKPKEMLIMKGISFKPHVECEWIRFIIAHNGHLFMPRDVETANIINESRFLYSVKLETFYAVPKIHIKVIDLLRHFGPKYFKNFYVRDDTYYWHDANEEELIAYFKEGGYKEDIPGGGMVNEERIMLEELTTELKETIQFLEDMQKDRNGEDDEGDEWKKLLD